MARALRSVKRFPSEMAWGVAQGEPWSLWSFAVLTQTRGRWAAKVTPKQGTPLPGWRPPG